MGWLTHSFGWHSVFVVMGIAGILLAVIWLKTVYEPKKHPKVNEAELAYIEQGGGLISMDDSKSKQETESKWPYIKQLLTNRMHWRVHRAILYYDSHLFLSHMVSGIFGSGPRHVYS